tara:strand:- start:130 stop:570 length:441 start_codon:yes stop_codon:yes gene_type:complete
VARGRFKIFVPPVLPSGYVPAGKPPSIIDPNRVKFSPPAAPVDDTPDVDKAKGRVKKEEDASAATTDHFIGVDTASQAVTITLPNTNSIAVGKIFLIKDEGGNAGTNNITIATTGDINIDGSSTIILDSDYASISVYYNGTEWSVY